MSNQSNDKVKNLFVIVLILCALIFIMYYLSKYTNIFQTKDTEVRTYEYSKGNQASKDLNLCKLGCYRGRCKNKNHKNNKFCKYDFQCNYCRDRKMNNFYVDLTNYEEVQPAYDTQEELSSKQQSHLNYEISENNEYIDELNDKIREYNTNND